MLESYCAAHLRMAMAQARICNTYVLQHSILYLSLRYMKIIEDLSYTLRYTNLYINSQIIHESISSFLPPHSSS